jgi:hypothetical protein
MATESVIAFAAESHEPPGLEIRVNFGMFAGREATPAEIDELAAALLPKVPEVSIVAEQRHEISPAAEASLHQVLIQVGESELPDDQRQQDELRGRLVEIAEQWAKSCFADRHAEISEL